eukprot:gb/GFBE01038843.1/.p1 GENE.gb/GFBE01038843.1/~~gb/GFBE01038843.1/.p1  ORF type:complete len:434 (+),score=76.46 gb/GFBE01038843.1/:1-1302(+)
MPSAGRGEKRPAPAAPLRPRPPATPQQRPRPSAPVALSAAQGKCRESGRKAIRPERKRFAHIGKQKTSLASAWKHGAGGGIRHLPGAPKEPATRCALRIYQELHREYTHTLEQVGHYEACSHAAELAAKRYKELHASALELLLRSCQDQAQEKSSKAGGCGTYKVLTFQGKAVDMKKRGKFGLSARLAQHRKERRGCLRDALCSALACLCSRLQKSWLTAYDDEAPVRGYFAHALVDPASSFRIALRPGRMPRLASLLITSELPLGRALALMDHGGPFPEGHAKEAIGERQYGLQRIGVDFGTGEERKEKLMDVQPEEKIRDLMASNTPVLVLDVYCALAPKDQVDQYSLGGIIRQELVALLQGAKQRGQAVVFLIGGEYPAMLAQKVYLQPWFTSIGGLRCGYLRWKESPEKPWEMPKLHHTKRIMFGLQLP